ncbi:MAG TPA: phage/plasmid primase, P4 family [Isosphaeraceae bacterium]
MITALGHGRVRLKALHAGARVYQTAMRLDDVKAITAFAAKAAASARKQFDSAIRKGDLFDQLRRELDELNASGAMAAAQVDAEDKESGVHRAPDDPHRLARIHLFAEHHHADRPTLVNLGHDFLAWDGRRYVQDRDVSGVLTATIERDFARLNKEQAGAAGDKDVPAKPRAARKVTTRLVNDARHALASLVRVPASLDEPAWLTATDEPFPAREVVPFPNALVSLPRYARGEPCSLDPTPAFFSTRCLPYEFDPEAPRPRRWLGFLRELWPDDPESVQALREWFGYCLVPDTSLQKILMVIGPTRSGKGTIGRVLTDLIGRDGVAAPSLATLASHFGAASLIGKLVAIVPDARLSGRADQDVLVERMLSISGEDRMEIDLKHRDSWVGTLPTRLMLLSNEVPRLRDASLALANRLVVLRLTRTFLGREDTALTDRLRGELPGIFNWAVKGWHRLQHRGQFAPPASSREILRDVRNIASPVAQFIAEVCEIRPDAEVSTERIYARFREWCEAQGKFVIPDKAVFGRDLRAVMPTLANRQRAVGGQRTHCFCGIRLRLEGLA